jgi:hypothetical protein
LESKECYAYDEKGNVESVNFYDEDGELIGRYLYSYDSRGNMVESIGNRYRTRYQYVYDECDNVVESKEYDAKEETLRSIAEFKIYYRQK